MPYSSFKLKNLLLKSGRKEYKCECCGNTKWLGKPISLELHHINGINNDNRIENLQIMSKSEHITYHNSLKEIIRDDLGRIVGVVKLSNIGEGCDANPEINSEIAKGSESSYSVEGE